MCDSKDWADAVVIANKMERRNLPDLVHDARIMVESVTRNVVLCGGPIEIFSDEMPIWFGSSAVDDLRPIDVLYGRYIPKELKIEIFVNRIREDAPLYHCEFLDLLTIVRIHEFAHAIVHAGVNTANCVEQLGKLGPIGTTDWGSFRVERDRAFSELDEESSELLAQAITWACVTQEPAPRLAETFLALEKRQPQRYRLPSKVKQRARLADWGLVLRVAQGGLPYLSRASSTTLARDLGELIRRSTGLSEGTEIPNDDPLVGVVANLQQLLADVDVSAEKPASGMNLMELLIKRHGCIELRMYKEKGHHRPHVHIDYKGEHSASYALDSFTLLAGYMPRKYEDKILPFAQANRRQLIERWQSLNGMTRITLPES